MKKTTQRVIGVTATIVLLAAVSIVESSDAAAPCKATGKSRVGVTLRQPASGDVAGVSLVLGYPKDRVVIPGEREDASVKGRVQDLPAGFLSSINDGDGEIRVSLASGTETFKPDAHFTVEFDRCAGDAPAAKDFRCTVESAALSCGSAIDDVSCVVSLDE